MTTATLSPTHTVTQPRSSAARTWHYFIHSLAAMLRDWAFMAFIIALPVTMYLFFAGIYGDQEASGGVAVAAVMMVTMTSGLPSTMSLTQRREMSRSYLSTLMA